MIRTIGLAPSLISRSLVVICNHVVASIIRGTHQLRGLVATADSGVAVAHPLAALSVADEADGGAHLEGQRELAVVGGQASTLGMIDVG